MIIFIESLLLLWFISSQRNISPRSVAVSSKTQDKGRRVVTIEIYSGGKWAAELMLRVLDNLDIDTVCDEYTIQGVPYHWAHFVFVIFSGSRAHTEELFKAIG